MQLSYEKLGIDSRARSGRVKDCTAHQRRHFRAGPCCARPQNERQHVVHERPQDVDAVPVAQRRCEQ